MQCFSNRAFLALVLALSVITWMEATVLCVYMSSFLEHMPVKKETDQRKARSELHDLKVGSGILEDGGVSKYGLSLARTFRQEDKNTITTTSSSSVLRMNRGGEEETITENEATKIDVVNEYVPEWSGDRYECIGWKSTSGCRPESNKTYNIQGGFIGCDALVPRNVTGYCVFKDRKTGKLQRIMKRTSCAMGNRPFYEDFRCSEGITFQNYKGRARYHRESPPMPTGSGLRRGIVFSVGDKYLIEAYANVKWLRDINCTLPIEFWSLPGELNQTADKRLIELLEDPLLTVREVPDASVHGWFIKAYGLYHSSFDEVLLMDVDSFPVRDPSYLFEAEGYRRTGAYFFKDRLQPDDSTLGVTKESLFWEMLGIPFVDEFEQESGQMVVNRARSRDALEVLMFFVRTFDEFFGKWRLVYGDKDLFRLAWRLVGRPFYYNPLPPGEAGKRVVQGRIVPKVILCSGSMVQFDWNGEMLFFHRSLPKLHKDFVSRVWDSVIKFTGTDPKTQHRTTFISGVTYLGKKWFCAWRDADQISKGYFEVTPLYNTDIPSMEKKLQRYARRARILDPEYLKKKDMVKFDFSDTKTKLLSKSPTSWGNRFRSRRKKSY